MRKFLALLSLVPVLSFGQAGPLGVTISGPPLPGFINAIVTPESFGATGNGVTDDSVAVQNAMTAVWTAGGGIIQFGNHVYIATGLVWPTGPSTSWVPLTIQGQYFTPMTNPTSLSTLVSPGYTVIRNPAAGGITFLINGTSASNAAYFATIQYIVLEGPTDSASLSSSNIGIQIGGYAQWTVLENLSLLAFGDQAIWGGGIDAKYHHIFTVQNLRRQPRTRISGVFEVYGTDQHISGCEINGDVNGETTMVDPTLLYNCDMLVQCQNSFFDDTICESGDVGFAMVGRVNAAPLSNLLSYPEVCIGNTISRLRVSNTFGNGLQEYPLNGQYPQTNAFVGCLAANNGLDTTSVRTSAFFGIATTSSDANFVLNGQQNIFVDAVILDSSASKNLYYGLTNNDQSSTPNGLSIIRDNKMQAGAFSLAPYANTGSSGSITGTKLDDVNSGVTDGTPSSNNLDITGTSEYVVADGSAQTITNFITQDNISTVWSGATAYVSGNVVSITGSTQPQGYICILANTNQTPPNATYWTALNQYPRYGQHIRIISQHGQTTITNGTGNITTLNGRNLILNHKYASADFVLFQGQGGQFTWCQVGTPALSVTTGTVTPGAIAVGTTYSTTVSLTGSLVGDFISVQPLTLVPNGNLTITGQCLTAGTITIQLANATLGIITPSAGTLRVWDQN